ncbi:MAG: PatB family C-S lyase [Rikenellaceae bacterium]|jgi:cystathionine beta-lyase|nr:PatB family C-S lyase [Rikenellaceae bacterium]
MKYDFDTIPVREGSGCEKYDSRTEVFGRGDVIPMWVADMDFEALPAITEAIMRRAAHPVYGYEPRPDSFWEAACNWMARRHGWHVDRSQIDFTPGVVSGIVCAMRAVTEPGDRVVINPPVYAPFARVTRTNGRTLVESPMVEAGPLRYVFDFDDLDRKLAGARALILCNPHNPTGRVLAREELARIGELCVKHNVTIISDEIHSDLVMRPHRHIPIATIDDEVARRTVTLVAPSKTFNIAGLSTSLAIITDEALRRRFCAEFDSMHIGTGNPFGAAALEAAYNHGEQWLEQLLEYLEGNMDYVEAFIARHTPRIVARKSEGTYMMWLDMRALGLDERGLREFLVDRARLGLNPGTYFGTGGEGFARINLATSRRVVEQAMAQLGEAYNLPG